MNDCAGPHSHIVDSRFYSNGYTTNEARRIFCDVRRFQRWLDVEKALALCEAELGIIPMAAAQEMERTGNISRFDLDAIRTDIAKTGHSLIPLLTAWENVMEEGARRFIHFGATTQDIQDTAQSLELKEVLAIVDRDMRIIIKELIRLAIRYRDVVTIGRTHGQHALPTTMGLKIAVWLDELLRGCERMADCCSRVLVSQLFGGVGTMDALTDRGLELLDRFSARLGLLAPFTAWHAARDRLAELLSCMAILAGSLGKIANEICQLARNEIGELEEPFHMGKIGSTTMPHKRNPESCEQVVVLARLIKANAGLGFEALINEHERDYRAVRLEWVTVTDSSLFLCGALHLMKSIVTNLIVHETNIQRNVECSAALISTEAVMFLLGEKIGKPRAHQLIYEAAMAVYNSGQSLTMALAEHPEIKPFFNLEMLKAAINPGSHTGLSKELTDRVVARADEYVRSTPNLDSNDQACPLAGQLAGCGACQHLTKE